MLCSSIPDDHAASVIILYTPFCEVMVGIERNDRHIFCQYRFSEDTVQEGVTNDTSNYRCGLCSESATKFHVPYSISHSPATTVQVFPFDSVSY